MTSEARSLIQDIPSLKQVRGPLWNAALSDAMVIRHHHGESLDPRPMTNDHFSIVIAGGMAVRIGCDDGRVFNTHKVRAGEMCVLSLTMLANQPIKVSDVVAEGDLVLIRIPARYLDALMAESKAFRDFALASMTSCFVRMVDLVTEVAFVRLPQRIEKTLYELSETTGQNVLRITHQDIANDLGSSREVISRLLKAMERDGRLKLGRGAITLYPQFKEAYRERQHSAAGNSN